ncbi:MAG TPA: hydantoinase/oxoprolinase family protein [Steroidobacteraceae bacterium]|nr:hydantoinase/oxoprolinase family protein [Steroidobacteraceae bacterium]
MNIPPEKRIHIAVDIGGTFTDLVAFDESSGRLSQSKALTTPAEFSRGVWDCLGKAQLQTKDAASLVHGSTVAINIAIEKTGAKTALVVTAGTKDVYKIGRQNRPDAYNFLFHRPQPLVPRSRTIEANERLLVNGEVSVPLTEQEATRIGNAVKESGAQSVAICFLHSYIDPNHEEMLARTLRSMLGSSVYVTASSEIVREYREYERISTTVMNAYIGPKTSAYIGRIESRLENEGFRGKFLIMQSNGGAMSPNAAKMLPVAMMESGPVGGVLAAAQVGKRLGYANVISFDMGGTTAKTSLIKDSEISIAQGYHIGGYASGHPVAFPVVDIIEIGAGGGSIAWIDEIGALRLGPKSASSSPGPICYGLGGTEPTVTDANVVLGRIGATSFLGGEMPLDAKGAENGMSTRIGARLGMTANEVAQGIVQIAVAKMSLAVRGVSVERGYDPRDFAMLASGGAGPPHALAVARELHIPIVIIPNLPAHFSALGMLMSDIRHDYVRTYYKPLVDSDFGEVRAILTELGVLGSQALADADVPNGARSEIWWMDLRYVGQEFCLQIPVSREDVASGNVEGIRGRFNEVHDRRFGHASLHEPLELVNLRLTSLGARAKITFPAVSASAGDAKVGTRPVILEDAAHPIECPVYRRERLAAGSRLSGPCIIEEYASTTVLFAGDVLTVAPTGELIIEVAQR